MLTKLAAILVAAFAATGAIAQTTTTTTTTTNTVKAVRPVQAASGPKVRVVTRTHTETRTRTRTDAPSGTHAPKRPDADNHSGGSSSKFCPPGLAKKNNGCLPPGQAKKQGD